MKNNLFKSLALIIIVIAPFTVGINNIFFGFEYEDAFINSHVATQNDTYNFSENYRTLGCDELIKGECQSKSSYTGHYISYALYMNVWQRLVSPLSYNLHKISNLFLYLTSVSLCFLIIRRYNDTWWKIFLFFLIFSISLPSLYVLNSSLIENISCAISFILIATIYRNSCEPNIKLKILIILLLAVLLIIKRENLILLLLIPLVIKRADLKNILLLLCIIGMFIAQLIINPFYTEILEASYLRESTFSVNYLRFQFPVYASNFISFEGFLGITILILLYFKLTKISKAFIALAFLFIILYSFHYRSQFAVRTEEITLFDTFRYMTNVVPLFFGVILFSNLRKFRKLKTLSLIGFLVFLGYNSFIQIKGFIEDEERNYHLVNERIEDSVSKDERALIVDNFNIISILNKKLNNVDVIKYVKGWEEEIDIYTYDRIFIINRFNLIDDNINQIGMSAFKTETTVIGESEVFQIFIE